MRPYLLGLLVALPWLACKPPEKSAADRRSDEEPPPGNPDPGAGTVQVDTEPPGPQPAGPQGPQGPQIDPGSGGAGLTVTGQVNLATALTAGADPDEVIGFEVSGSQFFTASAQKLLHFPVSASGGFKAELPKQKHENVKFFTDLLKPDGSVDVQLAKQKYPPQDVQGKTDAEVVSMVREGIDYYFNIGYVLVASTKSAHADTTWVDRVQKRKLEADTFDFIGMSAAADATFLGMPVEKAKIPALELGTLERASDEAKSDLAVSEEQFAIPQAALDELAQTNTAYKRIKNAYVNVDPADQKEVGLGQTFGFKVDSYHDALLADGYTDPATVKTTYQGFQIEISTNRTDFTLAKMCQQGAVRLYPPAGTIAELAKKTAYAGSKHCPAANSTDDDAKKRYFCDTNPATNGDATVTGSGDKCFSPDAQPAYMFGASFDNRMNNGVTEAWARVTWGTDDGFVGVPADGWWRLEIDGLGPSPAVAYFDMAKGYPFNAGGDPLVYVPRVRFTRDGNKQITGAEVVMVRWDPTANAGNGAFVPATGPAYDRTVVRSHQLSLWLDDQTPPAGQQSGRELELRRVDPVPPGQPEVVFTADPADVASAQVYLGKDNGGQTTSYYEAESFQVSYNMFGSSYRFLWIDHDPW